MYKKKLLVILLFINIFLSSCTVKQKILPINTFNFFEFEYNDNVYILYDGFCDDYSFYGPRHFIGYTRGAYNPFCPTYVLDSDYDENVLFQHGRYFWVKKGITLVDENTEICKLLINARVWDYTFETHDDTVEIDITNCKFSDIFIPLEGYSESYTESSRELTFSIFYSNNVIYHFPFIMLGDDGNVYCRETYRNGNLPNWYKVSDEYAEIIKSNCNELFFEEQ